MEIPDGTKWKYFPKAFQWSRISLSFVKNCCQNNSFKGAYFSLIRVVTCKVKLFLVTRFHRGLSVMLINIITNVSCPRTDGAFTRATGRTRVWQGLHVCDGAYTRVTRLTRVRRGVQVQSYLSSLLERDMITTHINQWYFPAF